MKRTELIEAWTSSQFMVTEELLQDALDLYEYSLDIIIKWNHEGKIPGLEDFNLSHDIITTYYRENPHFMYERFDGKFTPEQITTLKNIVGDIHTRERIEQKMRIKKYSRYLD